MVEEKNRFNPTFENGGYWEYYKDIERQFESFLELVPYLEGNERTYSFRLANIMLVIGAHIDSAFKKIAQDPYFISEYPEMINPKIKKGVHKGEQRDQEMIDYLSISEQYKLYEKGVIFKRLPNSEEVFPFKEYKKEFGKVPYWWTAYNGIKHDFSANFVKADLMTTRDALAGAFLLNVVYKPASERLFKYHMLTPKYQQGTTFFETYNDNFNGQEIYPKRDLRLKYKNPFKIETSLFSYDYEEPSENRT